MRRSSREIYNGDEQFPIKDVGCYSWRTGEHSQGTAVDINWEENMEATINADGSLTPTTGSHWSPGEDPYSIPEGGDVYNAFTKYGFRLGRQRLDEQARLHALQLLRPLSAAPTRFIFGFCRTGSNTLPVLF